MTFIKLFLEDRLESLIFYYDLPRMCFDLLTYAPLLVTEQVTVDTALQNLMTKESLPVFSEEGVYKVVIDIVLQRSSEFKNIFLLLRGFHTAKAAECCIGKFIEVSGIEDALPETNTNVMESVINGNHYNHLYYVDF